MLSEKKVTPYLVLVFGIFAVSSASILIRFAQENVPSLVIAAFRLTIAAIILFPIILKRYRPVIKQLKKTEVILLLISGVFLAVHFATWISSLEYTSVASSVVLVTTTPIWVAILSPIFLKEKTSFVVWIGILVTLFGSLVVSLQDACWIGNNQLFCDFMISGTQRKMLLGDFLALCGAWAAAGYMMVGRKVRQAVPVTVYIFFVYSIAAFLLIISCVLLKFSFTGYASINYMWLLLLGLVPQLMGHSSFNYALGYLPASYVSVALLGEPVGSIILAYFMLQENPGIGDLVGGGLIILGILLISIIKEKRS